MNQQMPGALKMPGSSSPIPGMPQKQCKHCRQLIDAKAKRCPFCSGDLRNWFARHPVIVVLLVIFVGFPFLGGVIAAISGQSTSNKTDSSKPSAQQQVQYETVDINTLISDYDANQLAANEKYANRNLQFTGFVDNISKDILGSPFIIIEPTTDPYYFGTRIQCFTSEAEATKLTNGKQATMAGQAKEMSMGNIIVKECVVK